MKSIRMLRKVGLRMVSQWAFVSFRKAGGQGD